MKRRNTYKLVLIAIMFMVTISAFCVPAKRVWRTMTLTDGTTIEVMMSGDEHGHWFVDRNGKALHMNDAGKMEYLTTNEFANIQSVRKERITKANARRMERINATRALSAAARETKSSAAHKAFGKPTTISGQKRGLVILVNYSDKSFKAADSLGVFKRRFNEVGYNENGYVGSVHDYFYDQSYGLFDLTFDVVGPVTVSRSHNYYGTNDDAGNDKYAATMVIEAIKLADAQGVDFSRYDWDGDGAVEQVFVIYAGTGENASDVTTDIWPHEYNLSEAKEDGDGTGVITTDGVKIDTYAVSCELANSSTIDGIGTACHEFSHCLGYADLYDTDYSGGPGMQYWDLLDRGSYNGPDQNGEVPAAYSSFERWWAGWMDITVLDKPQFITDMPALNDEGVAYKIINDAHPNEYYLLENRQAKKWDSYTASNGDGTGHGMMILHVDYDEEVWTNNAPNDSPSHQRMTFFPADNSYGTKQSSGTQYYWSTTYADIAGDPFPGTSNNSAFTDDTKPASTLYNANTDGSRYMGKPITDITETDELISFTFMGGLEIPNAIDATKVSKDGTSFTANWETVEGADSYDLEVNEVPEATKTPVIDEDFTGIKIESTNDISNSLDKYTNTKGWTGYKIYPNIGKLKVGSSKAQGTIISPDIIKEDVTDVTVKFSAANYVSNSNKADQGKINIKILDTYGNTIASNMQVSLSSTKTDYVFSFNNISADEYKVCLEAYYTGTCRFYLYNISIYNGEFTADDLAANTSAKVRKAEVATTDSIITGLTSTSYTMKNLNPDVQYRYRVRANIGDKKSDWSKYIKVESPTGIDDVISDESNKVMRIYNLNGQFVGSDINSLPRGIYIIGTRKYIKK